MVQPSFAIFRCVTGVYDNIPKDVGIIDWCDRYVYTDAQSFELSGYISRECDAPDGPLLANRRLKIKTPDDLAAYDVVIYLDGNVAFNEKIKDLAFEFYKSNAHLGLFKHVRGHTLEQEIDAVLALKKAEKTSVMREISFLNSQKYFQNLIYDNSIIFKRRFFDEREDAISESAMNHWYNIVSDGSRRDQLSLSYILDKYALRIHRFPLAQRDPHNGIFLVLPHRSINFSARALIKNFLCGLAILYWRIKCRTKKLTPKILKK